MERIDRFLHVQRLKTGKHPRRDSRLDDPPLSQDDGVGAIDGHRRLLEPATDRLMQRIEDGPTIALIGEHASRSRFAAFGSAESSEGVLTHVSSRFIRVVKRP
jgi:hypothetical protein